MGADKGEGAMAVITACVLQAGTTAFDTEATLAKAEALIAEAGRLGSRIAVLPEGFVGGYPKGADFHIFLGARTPEGRDEFRRYFEAAILVPGPETARLGRAARSAGLFLTAGVIERDGGTLYCTALFFGPDGSLLGKHRKLMPTALERLLWGFGDGSTPDGGADALGRHGRSNLLGELHAHAAYGDVRQRCRLLLR